MNEPVLSDEQYKILIQEENAFETLVKQGWCKNLDPRFLGRVKEVYSDFFHSPLNINCSSCINHGMTRLYHFMNLKKEELRVREENQRIQEMIQVRDKNYKRK